MSFLIATPELFIRAATNLEAVGSAVNAANSAVSWTEKVAAMAADEVSGAVASWFGGFAQEYQMATAQAGAFHERFLQTLAASAASYEHAEAANISSISGILRSLMGGVGAQGDSAAQTGGGGNTGQAAEGASSGQAAASGGAVSPNSIAAGATNTTTGSAVMSGGTGNGGTISGGGAAGSGGASGATTAAATGSGELGGSGGVAALSSAAATTAAVSSASTGDGGVAAAYSLTSQWDSGFIGRYTITNSADTAASDWQIEFDLPADESITNVWNGELVQSGTHYTVTPESWTQTIEPGGSVTVGFQGAQTGSYSEPTNLIVNGVSVGGGGSGDGGGTGAGGTGSGSGGTGDAGGTGSGTGDTGGTGSGTGDAGGTGSGTGDTGGTGSGTGDAGGTGDGTGTGTGDGGDTGGSGTGGTVGDGGVAATYTVTSQWDNGFVANYTISNSGDTALTDWQVEFDLPANEPITSVWSGQLTQTGTHYTLTPEAWTQTIEPGGSVVVGFQAMHTGAYSEPTNVLVNGQPASGGGTGTGGGTSTGGGTGTGGTGTGGTDTSTGGATVGEFSPYVDMTLWPKFDYASAANAGIDDVTLGFIVTGADGNPSWGTFYSLDDPWITSAMAEMQQNGIDPTISFGGAANQPLAVSAPNAAALASDYKLVTDTYGIYKLDFDIEGAALYNVPALTNQAQAIAMLQAEQAAAGTPVQVSYTLPVMPTGLTSNGVQALQIAIDNGVDVGRVNIMTMDYFDPSLQYEGRMGDYAIQAAESVHGQLMTLYPSMSSEDAWAMIKVTPMIGVNDDPSEVFTLADAEKLAAFADENNLGGLSMWSANRDFPGAVGQLSNTSSGVSQQAWDFSEIFDEFAEDAAAEQAALD
ncbi:cellulose binding domain-containing protein [Mycobacterium marinum]|uniref:cellulose binding domain-containing protein n=1 Tax=Mycobacterium marinum TaxID=1781 RepID=UPI00235816DD|nr:cellulose binding domain-containing protein [Mycobacterium marinum]MDC8983457.1 cellulose binding domain-containing protein [Mycobacterium marinum]MDC9000528.1 cellulose binding domain-containing protein [Mycobacterium marinum]MDC9011009.1 cellulose binding domain-containing protein [Mycobacterium marinum]